jgi:iron complex outermembrane recepter protein
VTTATRNSPARRLTTAWYGAATFALAAAAAAASQADLRTRTRADAHPGEAPAQAAETDVRAEAGQTEGDSTAANAARYQESIDVIGVTPLRGLGVPRDRVPGNVQSASAADLERTGALHLGDALARSFASVSVNEAQGNPFQPDLQFRGFTLSPLLGLPQGVAVYQDGVRVNEPFGDTLHWDLLPDNAIAAVDLVPGSSPLFGLNALGGALAIQTRTGWSHPGGSAAAHGGSFGRLWLEGASGGHGDRTGYFAAARLLEEDGWRDHSPSRLRQLFGSIERRGEQGRLDATATLGANRLIGNGAAPIELLELDREAVFTHPDQTENEVGMLSLRGDRGVGDDLVFEGTLHYRPVSIDTFNGDDTPYAPCESDELAGLLCVEDDGEAPIHDQNGDPVRVGAESLDATNNTSSIESDGWGLALQATSTRPLGSRDHHLIGGLSLDAARSRYGADTELARLTADRGTIGTGVLDGAAAVRLHSEAEHHSLWLTDFLTVTPRLTLMGAARYTESAIELRDRLGVELDGDHTFSRLNPSAGFTWEVGRGVTAFASFAMASRVPAPSELSCADPEDPCRLPNAFVADPPLDQVVARTWEAGARGRAGSIAWAGAAFETTNRDDIVFVSSGALTNQGHFTNVGDTRRRGLELSASGAATARLRWQAAYSHLQAEFRAPLLLPSPNHPQAVEGEIAVEPGDALPGIPRHQVKAQLAWSAGKASATAAVVYASERYLRGDEANLLRPLDGYAVVDAGAAYAIRERVVLSARLSNLLDAEYETFGLLGEADDVLGDDFENPRFVSPAAPFGVWLGIEITWR